MTSSIKPSVLLLFLRHRGCDLYALTFTNPYDHLVGTCAQVLSWHAVDLTAADAKHLNLSIEVSTLVQHIYSSSALLDIDATRQPEHKDP